MKVIKIAIFRIPTNFAPYIFPYKSWQHCKYISLLTSAYRDLELHRSSTVSGGGLPNGGAATTSSVASSSFINGDTSETSSRMREKLAALEDLNELLEEPVEEQVSRYSHDHKLSYSLS